jgi:galactokinase
MKGRSGSRLLPSFHDLFGAPAGVVARAPGRVNLIGEHTDYNDGYVLPAAIPLRTEVQLRRRADRHVRVWSAAFPREPPVGFDLAVSRPAGDWADYLRAIVNLLRERGVTGGVDVRIDSRVPLGSGLSSSASLLIAAARALREAFNLPIDDRELAILARRAENEFVGAPVGIMDPFACSLADEQGALLLDTRSLVFTRVRLPADAALLVIDSGVRHAHAGGGYRVRREECARAADALGVPSLRDAGLADLDRIARLPPPLDRRARHVVSENARVLEAARALERGDLARTGELFLASHASMRDDFEVSIPEIDALVAAAADRPGVYGARLTGGGFGGSIVAIVDPSRLAAAGAAVIARQHDSSRAPARIVVPDEEPPSAR